MNVQLTVRDLRTRADADLLVTADDRGGAAALLTALRSAVGATEGVAVRVADRTLSDDSEVADCALAAGDVVVVGDVVGSTDPPVVDVVVESGPDAGRRFALSLGRYVAGRDPGCDLPVIDPAISWHHVTLDVIATDLHIAASADTRRVPLTALPMTLQLGDSTVRIAPHRPLEDYLTLGTPRGNAAHREAATEPVVITMPPAPTESPRPRLSLLPAAVPLLTGVALTFVLHQWEFLAFTAASPLTVIGQAIADRRVVRRKNAEAQRDHAEACHRAQLTLEARLAEECARRHQAAPDLGGLCSPSTADDALWRRTGAELLRLRLGVADQPSDIDIRGGDRAVAHSVPLVAALPEIGVLGVIGPPALRRGLARSLVVQAAVLHDPAALRIIVIAPSGATNWGWVRWLPHVVPEVASCVATVGFDPDQIALRLAELRQPTDSERATLVIVDGTAAMMTLPDALPDAVTAIWCAPDAHSLPATCSAIASINDEAPARLVYTDRTRTVSAAIPDLVAIDVAAAAARRLSPLSTRSRISSAIPRAVRWGALGDVRPSTRWGAASTEIALGVGVAGAVRIDLTCDGPHALIAGTTGAGKSELLLTVVAELASRNRPDQLSLLLIDHKGGATLGSCARLPHTVGVVTDLDPVATRRALRSIGAELRRREQQLAVAGVPDFEAYQRRAAGPALTRLIIVVDEFAALVGDEPAAMAELVTIAQRGRSLGLHLILATQRPEGLVSADIRANTRIRICLGVTREQDSRDVIDSPLAAAISRLTPGRAYLRIGPGDLSLFQAARVTEPLQQPTVVVTRVPDAALGDPLPAPTAADHESWTELDELVSTANEAAARWRCDPPSRPWLPPLPAQITLAELPQDVDADAAPWGLVDQPDTATQPPLVITPSRGTTTLVIGAARSGRSTAGISIAVALAIACPPDQLHMWGIDAATGLTPLTDLPHCGAVIPGQDQERVRSLLDHLVGRVQDRRRGDEVDCHPLLIVIDGWEALLDTATEPGRSDLADQVLRLAADGPSVGVHVVITGDRSLLSGRVASVAGERIVLRLADPADYLTLGVARRDLPGELPPGRGLRASDLAMVQVGCADRADVRAATRWSPAHRVPATFASLPPRIQLSELRSSALCPTSLVTVGVRAVDLAAIRLSRADFGELFLVAGTRRSGRSSALQLIGDQLDDRPVVTVAHQRSPLTGCSGAVHIGSDDPDHALEVIDKLVAAGRPPHLLIDDLDQLSHAPLLDRIAQLTRSHRPDGAIVAVSAAIDSVATAFRGPLSAARQSGHGLLLRPASPRDGDIVGIDLRRRWFGGEPPGRGWLVAAGDAVRIQVAVPDADHQPSTEFELAALGARRRE